MLWNSMIAFFVLCACMLAAEETVVIQRPLADNNSIMAIYREDWGLTSANEPVPLFIAWPDGRLVWSENRVTGGAPYRTAQIDPEKIAALMKWFEKDGVFANHKLKAAHFGPESQFTTILIKNGKRELKLQSWHELVEQSGKSVAADGGATGLQGQRRQDVLRESKADYLYFRFVWSETRGRLMDLIPSDGKGVVGDVTLKDHVVSWKE